MMKAEFERIAGYEVSNDDYNNIIEPMYMATDLSKAEFVETISKKRFALKTRKQLKNEMKKLAKHLFETHTQYTDYEAIELLKEKADAYSERFYEGLNYNTSVNYFPNMSCYYPNSISIYGRDGIAVEIIELQ